jgi:EAL domain-containing protein (putative c-di-GMP-specific phosphodiesterase class I)
MPRRTWRAFRPLPSFVLVASDPLVIAAARDAAHRLHGPRPIHIASGAEALSRLVGPGEPPSHLVLDSASASGALLSAARDRFSATEVVVVAAPGDPVPHGLRAAPAEGARLAEALAPARQRARAPVDAASLAASLERGEITVRFQPVVRLADRRPIGVEALARWERPDHALGADAFVAMAERAGLATALTLAVARRALTEFAAARGGSQLRLSFNVPLAVLLRADLAARLSAIVADVGLRPRHLRLELTETTVVRDTALLRRALHRLGSAGFGVLLDDLALGDTRDALLDLPFTGVKLDRSMVVQLPRSRRVRGLVERLVRRAHLDGRAVVAEGVSDPLLWRHALAAGCDLAQGFGVGRPIPPEALPAWIAAWSGAETQPE